MMTREVEVFEALAQLRRQGVSSALAILIDTTGSSPQKAGAKMVVRSDGSILGTVGGGQLEAAVIDKALQVIKSRCPDVIKIELTEEHGYACGGEVTVYVEPVLPEPRFVIFGAGHVGRALCTAAKFSGFHVAVIDDRAEFANRKNLPEADVILAENFDEVFGRGLIDENTYAVIATRGHRHDFEVLRKVLQTDARYIGLVGSKKKKTAAIETLRQDGFSEEDTQRVFIPVGLPIGSVTPEEIAISIMAQVIQRRRLYGLEGVIASPCSGAVPAGGKAQAAP